MWAFMTGFIARVFLANCFQGSPTLQHVSIPHFITEYYSIVCICHILFIHSSTDGHLGCFYLLAMANNAAMNIHGQVFV